MFLQKDVLRWCLFLILTPHEHLFLSDFSKSLWKDALRWFLFNRQLVLGMISLLGL